MTNKILSALCALLLFTAAAPLLTAQVSGATGGMNKTVTFNNKVELPGMTLDRGSYIFKIMGDDMTQSQHHRVIQVYSSDQSKFHGNIIGIPDSRINSNGQDILMYPKGTSDDVQAVRAWFPSADKGMVLAYPKSDATKLAKHNNQTVPFTDATGLLDRDNTNQLMQATISAVSPTGAETSWQSPVSGISPDPLNRDMSGSQSSSMNQSDQVPDRSSSQSSSRTFSEESTTINESDRDLPATASSLPMFGLIGLLSIGAALVLNLAFKALS
jgi:hypothetical protein